VSLLGAFFKQATITLPGRNTRTLPDRKTRTNFRTGRQEQKHSFPNRKTNNKDKQQQKNKLL
jgi:hypothetical protein